MRDNDEETHSDGSWPGPRPVARRADETKIVVERAAQVIGAALAIQPTQASLRLAV